MEREYHTEFLAWDDTAIISDNPVVNEGLALDSMWAALKTETLNLWHPLTLWSHQLDVTLFGLNPDLHHLSAFIYHFLAGLALYFALRQIKTLRSSSADNDQCPLVTRGAALVTTLLFLLHPMHVESWAWLSERKDTLSAIFAFLSLNFWARFSAQKSSPSTNQSRLVCYGLSLLFLSCGLLCKPSLVVLPIILFLTSFWQKTHTPQSISSIRSVSKEIIILLPHLLIAALFASITYYIQLERGDDILAIMETRPFHQNLLAGFNNVWVYFYKIFFPYPLSYFYPPLEIYPLKGALAGLLLSCSLTYFSWKKRHSLPLLGWAWGSFFITLVPVCGFLISGEANAPDRYSYLAYTGPFLILAIYLHRLPHRVFLGVTSIVVIISSIYSLQRAFSWRNMESLTESAIQAHPENYAAHHHRALYHLQKKEWPKARFFIGKALKYQDGNRYLWSKLGIIEYQDGNLSLAQQHFRKQLLHNPNNLDGHIGLANIYLADDLYEKALPHVQKINALSPENKAFIFAMQQITERMAQKNATPNVTE